MAEVVEVKAVENGVAAPAPTTEEPKTTGGDVVMDDDEKERKGRARRQIEFYFADSNLPYDKFMWQLHTKDKDHWVPIETVASFKRMREYSKDGIPWVTDALRESELLEVDETGTKVRRRSEVKEPQGQFERSVYAKGFGEEDPTLQSRLEKFLQGYGSTNEVRMRREQDKSFKGSVFVEFTEPSGVNAFLNADPKPSWDGKELLIMTKEAYCEMKIKEKGLTGKDAERKKGIMNKRAFNAFKTPVSQGGLLADGDVDMEDEGKPKIYLEYFGKKLLIHRDSSGNGKVKDEEVPYVKGASLKFEGVGDNFAWNDIKTPLKDLLEGKVPFIDYTRGQNSGLVGFHRELSDEDITAIRKAVRTINGNEITWSKIDEEEEKKFQIMRAQSSARNAWRNTQENGSGGRGGRGGARGARGGARGGGRGRGRGGKERGRGRGRGRGGFRGGDRSETNGKDKAAEGGDASGSGSGSGSADGNANANGTDDTRAGEKRKRAVEPDGGPDVGVRGQGAPPKIQLVAPPKKVKTETGELPSPSS